MANENDGPIAFYWVSFLARSESDLIHTIYPQTIYAEFVCYTNVLYEMVFVAKLVVQGLIVTNIVNMRKGSAIYDWITVYGVKYCSVLPISYLQLENKRLFLQYASVMYPNASFYTSVGGNIGGSSVLQLKVPDNEKAIHDYVAVNNRALTVKDYEDSREGPFDLFNWWEFCSRVSNLEFKKTDEQEDEYIVTEMKKKFECYLKYKPKDPKKVALFKYFLGEDYVTSETDRIVNEMIKVENNLFHYYSSNQN